jgi:hypothetical protein
MASMRQERHTPVGQVAGQAADHKDCVVDPTRPLPSSICQLISSYDTSVRVVGLLAIISLAAACARDTEEVLCPELAPGDLIITEVRGPQTPADAINGEWVELFNASGRALDLIGTHLRFRRKDGSSEVSVFVRENLTVGAGDYVVLGLFLNDATRPSHVNYGFAGDFTEDWLMAAAIDIETCGTFVERATYDALPKQGTFSLTGAIPPDRNTNDDLANWCTNATPAGTAFPGTPQQANPPCP